MRSIGLHLRLISTFSNLVARSCELGMSAMQCFLVDKAGQPISLDAQQINECATKLRNFSHSFMHASYWTNLSGVSQTGRHILMKEMDLAKRLGFTHVVVHPGSAKGVRKRSEGVDLLVKSLNKILKEEQEITIVLENVAHGRMTVGGDLQDFKTVLQKIDKPEAIKFCIDTAHAHSYGYDMSKNETQDKFIKLLDDTIGLSNIALIHLNDTHEKVGSLIDRHAAPGEGTIGIDALKRFAQHCLLKHIPMILELPVLHEEHELVIYNQVRAWHDE